MDIFVFLRYVFVLRGAAAMQKEKELTLGEWCGQWLDTHKPMGGVPEQRAIAGSPGLLSIFRSGDCCRESAVWP
jgi:hypothetical protein